MTSVLHRAQFSPEAKASGLPVSATTVIITPKWQFSRNLHRRLDNRHACYQVWDVPSLPESMYRLKKIRVLSLLFLGFWQHWCPCHVYCYSLDRSIYGYGDPSLPGSDIRNSYITGCSERTYQL